MSSIEVTTLNKCSNNGVVVHQARTSALQAEGSGFETHRLHMYDWTNLKEAVRNSRNQTECLKIMNIPLRGGNYRTLLNKVDRLHLNTSHWSGKGVPTGGKKGIALKFLSNDELFNKHSSKKLERLKPLYVDRILHGNYQCEICGISSWNGKDIVLQLHHINGVHNDNRVENLQLLCPNCHSQTENFCGKNK